MRKWLSENPKGKHGNHHPEAATFGIERDELRLNDQFAKYMNRYGTWEGMAGISKPSSREDQQNRPPTTGKDKTDL